MYNGGVVLGASTTVAGVAVLPNTGSSTLLQYLATAAIITGVVVLCLNVAVIVYRAISR